MRAARLIRMVLLLQSRPAMTAAELARELGVSERTVTRDAQALSEAGVPVYADRGRTGGYRLVDGYRTRLTGLARGEAEALFLSGVPGALREMGLEDAASTARLKVSAALLPSLRDASRTAAQRFHLDAPGWFREPRTPDLLPVVADAVWGDRRIAARYRRRADGAGDHEVVRTLEPYGLVLKAGVWYLCARALPEPVCDAGPGTVPGPGTASAHRTAPAGGTAGGTGGASPWASAGVCGVPAASRLPGAFRVPGTTPAPDDASAVPGTPGSASAPGSADTPGSAGACAARGARGSFRVYRIDRFCSVAPTGDHFVRDEAFDLPAFWEEQAERFARALLRTTVVVRLTPEGARQLPGAVDPVAAREALAGATGPDARGRVTATLPVESEAVAYSQLLALGPEAEVLCPAALRARLAEAAERTSAQYREPRPPSYRYSSAGRPAPPAAT
ncbi:hypothetical protein GCM10018793_15810 [Streptomyces sulfonofaciens]|uniref:HTH deoR-type domain-containing protein n=1 Tax=Streptomyces sulfonofaciens TaxID=68272 RepID=A0A919FXZ7_9ACTN|nr:WYL domain-containing protein [Streptomyces sulfonofaciens]GHH74480.1 hypothetical protein GCM10018793_15810 [Streptomyces sulfonofaciens]